MRHEAFGQMRFRIGIEGLDEAGACEVVFPEARIVGEPGTEGASRSVRYGTLLLRRGVTRSRSWYDWWDQARTAEAPPAPRTIVVSLLDASQQAVHRWKFERALPLAYALSPLDALGQGVLVETLELAVADFVLLKQAPEDAAHGGPM